MTYVDDLMARCPVGSPVYGDCPIPRSNNNLGARMAVTADESKPNGAAHPTPGIGHNSEAMGIDAAIDEFDSIAAANLKRGLYRSQAECWRLASNDPRCTWRHLRILGIVFGFINNATATAFPGWRAIQTETAAFSGGVPDPAGGYSPGTIRNILSDLQRWGYLPSGGQRKGYGRLTLYTVGIPTLENLARDIAAHLGMKAEIAPKERDDIEARIAMGRVITPDDTSRVTGGDDTSPGRVTGRVTRGRAQELERELEDKKTLSSADADVACATERLFSGGDPLQGGAPSDRSAPAAKDAPCKPNSPDGDDEPRRLEMPMEAWQALAAYNEVAAAHRFTPCKTPTEDQAKRLTKRLKAVGGVRRFKRALGALPLDDFLMGRVPGKAGGKPFRLSLDRLLRTDGGMGDVLGRLLGLADERDAATALGAPADIEAALRQRAESPEGKRMLARFDDPEEGMRRLREIVTRNMKGNPDA